MSIPIAADPAGEICPVMPMPAPTQARDVIAWRANLSTQQNETVLEETPVSLVYNGIAHAVMLASPQDLEDFAVGFSLSEQIIARGQEIYDIELIVRERGIEVQIELASRAMMKLKASRRARTGKSGCGLCGMESLDAFDAGVTEVAGGGRLHRNALHRAMEGMTHLQQLHHSTGGAHAAGWADWRGQIRMVREDIGRHNALDKLIGALQRADIAADTGFIVVTSRASFEMVQKSVRAGAQVLAAVSAPTAMAIRMAERAGLTLAGFVRSGQHVVYTHPQRLFAEDEAVMP